MPPEATTAGDRLFQRALAHLYWPGNHEARMLAGYRERPGVTPMGWVVDMRGSAPCAATTASSMAGRAPREPAQVPIGGGNHVERFRPPPICLHELGRFQSISEDVSGVDEQRQTPLYQRVSIRSRAPSVSYENR